MTLKQLVTSTVWGMQTSLLILLAFSIYTAHAPTHEWRLLCPGWVFPPQLTLQEDPSQACPWTPWSRLSPAEAVFPGVLDCVVDGTNHPIASTNTSHSTFPPSSPSFPAASTPELSAVVLSPQGREVRSHPCKQCSLSCPDSREVDK